VNFPVFTPNPRKKTTYVVLHQTTERGKGAAFASWSAGARQKGEGLKSPTTDAKKEPISNRGCELQKKTERGRERHNGEKGSACGVKFYTGVVGHEERRRHCWRNPGTTEKSRKSSSTKKELGGDHRPRIKRNHLRELRGVSWAHKTRHSPRSAGWAW